MTQQEMEMNNYVQIDERENGGIHVALYYKREEFYSETLETFSMLYEDSQTGYSASFEIPKAKVLDAWKHPMPFVIAAQNGKPLAAVAA